MTKLLALQNSCWPAAGSGSASAPRWGEAVVEHEHALHVEALGDVRHELVRGGREGAVAVEELPAIRPRLSRARQWARVRWACTHQRVLGLETQRFAQQCRHSVERSIGWDLELGRPKDGRVARVLEVDDHLPVLDGRRGRRHIGAEAGRKIVANRARPRWEEVRNRVVWA